MPYLRVVRPQKRFWVKFQNRSRHGRVSDNDGRDLVRNSAGVYTSNDAVVAALPPPDGPRVLDEPVLHTVLLSEADEQYCVVDLDRVAVLFRYEQEADERTGQGTASAQFSSFIFASRTNTHRLTRYELGQSKATPDF